MRPIASNNRRGRDRRSNGYISEQKLFHQIPYHLIESELSSLPQKQFGDGEILIRRGQRNRYLFLLIDGALKIHLDDPETDEGILLEPGECVGEMSVIDRGPASATVVCDGPATVIQIDASRFWNSFGKSRHVARNMLRILTARMRTHNEMILAAREQKLLCEHLQSELANAADLQRNMLPDLSRMAVQDFGLELAGLMKPAAKVGGDLYDAFFMEDNHLCLAMGSVSGKGMPAALFMVQVMSMLRGQMQRPGDIAKRMGILNNLVCQSNKTGMQVSLFVAVIDLQERGFDYCLAGHQPPAVSRDGHAFHFLDAEASPRLGGCQDIDFTIGLGRLEPGDRFFIFTEGAISRQNGNQEAFGGTELLYQLDALPRANNARTSLEEIEHALNQHAAGTPQSEDIAMMAVLAHER